MIALLAIAPTAAAQPDEHASVVRPRPPATEPVSPGPVPAPAPDPTAADVAEAPLPGEESGRIDPTEPDSAPREIARGLLFFPRLAFDIVLAPVRGGIYLFERYRLTDRYRRTFFNDAMTIGVYPTLVIDSSLGVFAGARFEHRDVFGRGGLVAVQAAFGNRYRQLYSAAFRSRDVFGDRLRLELDVAYERRPHDAFWGIGNGDAMPPPDAPIDPLMDGATIESRYRQDRARVAAVVDMKLWDRLRLRPSAAISDVQFDRGDQGAAIDQVYMQDRLIGWNGVRYAYTELALRWDSRRGGKGLEPPSVYAGGSFLDLHGGRTHRLDDGPDFWRYGLDAQQFVRFGDGPRAFAVRLHGEGVTGQRDEVPFSQLPMLGGPIYLRGYELDRFRDRVAVVGSLSYQWDLSQWFSASLFTDAGRVYPSLSALTLDGMRVGYGIGLEAHSVESFVLEGSIATSIDGGVALNLSFNRVFDIEERVRRK